MISILRFASSGAAKRAFSAMVNEGFVVCDHSSPPSDDEGEDGGEGDGGRELVIMHNRDELDDVLKAAAPVSVDSQDEAATRVAPTALATRGWATTWAPPSPWRADVASD